MNKGFLFILILGALILTACGGGEASTDTEVIEPVPAEYAGKTNPLGIDAATQGEEIYTAHCESCHGKQGHGDGPSSAMIDPKPKNLPKLAQQVGDDYLFWRISTGRPGTSMAPQAGILTDEQIWQVIAYIRTLK